ncbi:kinase-like domain-containing protein [Cunninghamella echinulata]|nr:kinase-like domain-containing protein [Cunninghamella echinulata]
MSSPNQQHTQQPQQRLRIGQYQIIKTIGSGSFGKVKLATHAITDQKVALKFINRKKIASMDMSGRVKREIQYLKLLRHPHIIKLYEVITTATDIIMVIEYASKELFNYIVDIGKMSEDDARRFFQQIICAVEYCHRHKIVHRDLKPENLLLDANNNVKIADFGLSNIMTDGDFLKTSCGSPNYAAPEVISGKLYAGPEVDVWSCGVILYVMLCARLPFDDEYIPALFRKINGGIYTMPKDLSPEAKSLLASMLVVDPLKRITIQEIRQNPWFNKNLPDYLKPLPQTDAELSHQPIDESIVADLHKKMGYTTEAIHKALHDTENNPLKVAYQLVLDNTRLLQGSKQTDIQSFFASSPPPWNTTLEDRITQANKNDGEENNLPNEEEKLADSSISVLSSSIPKSESNFQTSTFNNGSTRTATPEGLRRHLSTNSNNGSSNHNSNNHTSSSNNSNNSSSSSHHKKTKSSSRSKWHFGIRSKCPAWEVMLEIYRSLKNVGMEWRSIDTYHLRCRYIYQELDMVVKFDLQLYKLENNSYLVDFKNVNTVSNKKKKGQQQQNQDQLEHDNDIDNPSTLVQENLLQRHQQQQNDKKNDLSYWTFKPDASSTILSGSGGHSQNEKLFSIYPFLDVCSKLITDIV